jgi:membrane protease YdiL (CAAX protease family)
LDSINPISPSEPEIPPPVEPLQNDLSQRENPVFNLVDVALIVLVAVVALVFCSGVVAVILIAVRGPHAADFKDPAKSLLIFLPIQVAAYVLTVGFMVFRVWTKYRTGFLQAVRWNFPATKIVYGALAGGAALGLTSELLQGLLQRWIPKSLPIEQYFRTTSSAYAMAAFGILVAPLVEELFFRGFLYPALARPLGVVWATALTAGSFALLHEQQLAHAWVPLLILFGVGTVLTVVRAVTKSLATCVLIHMGYNFTLFALTFIVTQGFRHMERAS